MDSQLKELHDQNGYYVGITKSPKLNKISVEYPADIIRFPESEPIEISYEIGDGYVYKEGHDKQLVKFKAPPYACRLLVITDILFSCINLGINSLLLTNFKDDETILIDTIDLLDPPENSEQQLFEEQLKVIFRQMMVGNNCSNYLANAEEIQEGYELLLNVFRTGGF